MDAVIFALRRIREGGCILADEVGLGKTIEAGPDHRAEGARRSSLTKSGDVHVWRLLMFLVPTSGVADWKELLADPDKHWREGYSAHALATRWQGTGGFPPEIASLLHSQPMFADIEMLLGIPEHKVPLPGGARASQTDLWVLGRTPDD